MTDKFGSQLRRVLCVPIFLERKNRQHQINVALDLLGATRMPCPELRRDIIDDFDSAPFHLCSQSKIKAREIHKHNSVRPALLGFAHELPEDAAELAVIL